MRYLVTKLMSQNRMSMAGNGAGRKPIGDRPMSAAERKRRSRKNKEGVDVPNEITFAGTSNSRTTTVLQATAIHNHAKCEIEPPSELRYIEGGVDLWNAIIDRRAKIDWNETDLHHAAELCSLMVCLRVETTLLAFEGYMIPDPATGGLRKNPRIDCYKTMHGVIKNYCTMLGLNGAGVSDSRGFKPPKGVQDSLTAGDDDGLLS